MIVVVHDKLILYILYIENGMDWNGITYPGQTKFHFLLIPCFSIYLTLFGLCMSLETGIELR